MVVVLCIYVSVFSCATCYNVAYEQYQQLQFHKHSKNKMAIFLKWPCFSSETGSVAELPDPTHRLVWCMHIICLPSTSLPNDCRVGGGTTSAAKCCVCMYTAIKHKQMPTTVCPFSASWRLVLKGRATILAPFPQTTGAACLHSSQEVQLHCEAWPIYFIALFGACVDVPRVFLH